MYKDLRPWQAQLSEGVGWMVQWVFQRVGLFSGLPSCSSEI